MRAAISACSVSGIRSGEVVAAALEQHPDRLLDEERVALGLREQILPRRGGRGRRCGSSASSELLALLAARAARARSPSRACGRRPSPGGTSSSSGRARQRISSGDSRTQVARCSISSSSGSSAQWMSSKTSTSGCTSASCSAHARAAQAISWPLRSLLDRLEHARGEAEQVGDGLVLAARAELLDRLLDRVVVGDPGRRLDHLGERPVGDALAVRQTAAGEHGRALEPGDELADEPALADAGLAVDRERGGRGGRGRRGRRCSRAARARLRGRRAAQRRVSECRAPGRRRRRRARHRAAPRGPCSSSGPTSSSSIASGREAARDGADQDLARRRRPAAAARRG